MTTRSLGLSRTILILSVFYLSYVGVIFIFGDYNSNSASGVPKIAENYRGGAPSTHIPSLRRKEMNTTGKFSFVHISKCAGATWIRVLKLLPLDVCPRNEAGKEHSVWYQHNVGCSNADNHLVSLRSPRHHVFSMFTECKYDGWGVQTTKNTAFPRSGNNPKDDEVDFNLWLDHFVPMGPDTLDMYNCYHPANYQSRHLTSKLISPHGIDLHKLDLFEPDATKAISAYWDMDFVTLAEFIHESQCLLYHRLGRDAPSKAVSYLSDKCHCPRATNQSEIYVTHHLLGHRSKLRDLPQNILSKVENLTAIDSKIYIIALREFMAEIAWLESTSALGRRVLCDNVLEELGPELAYLEGHHFNVTQLYMDAIGRM